ncbi:MAG TPA: hypothetical protein VNQ79_17805 [Blastocatellia bacterium]|nr:hypothetical protein [Blastocatellia bacterium]
MATDTSSAGGAMWALVTLLIVLLVVAVLWFGGVFTKRKSIDININKPGLILLSQQTERAGAALI